MIFEKCLYGWVCVRACARARVCVCVCVCVFETTEFSIYFSNVQQNFIRPHKHALDIMI